jgi:hypothetical protein
VLQRNETFRSSITSDINSQILGQVLRGVEIEYKHTSTSIHLASADPAEVDSLLFALDQIMKTHEAIQSHLESETACAAAPHLLAKLVVEVRALRNGFWPEHYRSCEALTRLLDTLELAQEMLATKAASASSLLCKS